MPEVGFRIQNPSVQSLCHVHVPLFSIGKAEELSVYFRFGILKFGVPFPKSHEGLNLIGIPRVGPIYHYRSELHTECSGHSYSHSRAQLEDERALSFI